MVVSCVARGRIEISTRRPVLPVKTKRKFHSSTTTDLKPSHLPNKHSLYQSGKTMSAFPGDYAAAETGIFWDIEDCKIDVDLNASQVLQNIKLTISRAGHYGTVSIRAYGDMTGHEFPSEGIKLNHFPAGERYARHSKMLEDIIAWSAEHPQPSNLMLIMKDTSPDFIEVVQLLKSKKNYMFHIVQPGSGFGRA